MSSLVSLVRNESYAPDALRQSIEQALALIGQPLRQLIRPGDRVLVKPYLRHGSVRQPETRMVSHPAVVEAVLGLVCDCGGRPQLGDEGSRRPGHPQLHHEALWLHLLAERFGAELVSFAMSGGRVVPSAIPQPASYLLSRAVLDADSVISLVNAQPHPSLMWSGALKNMFNTIIGAGNTQLSALLPDATELAGAVADVCRLARPSISVADMTSVCPGFKQELWRVGLLGASTDPVALDSACLQALGWEPGTIPSLRWGARLGVGAWEREAITLRGLDWQDLPVLTPPSPSASPEPPRAPAGAHPADSQQDPSASSPPYRPKALHRLHHLPAGLPPAGHQPGHQRPAADRLQALRRLLGLRRRLPAAGDPAAPPRLGGRTAGPTHTGPPPVAAGQGRACVAHRRAGRPLAPGKKPPGSPAPPGATARP